MGASQQNAHAYPRQFRSELFDIESLLESERFWQRNAWWANFKFSRLEGVDSVRLPAISNHQRLSKNI